MTLDSVQQTHKSQSAKYRKYIQHLTRWQNDEGKHQKDSSQHLQNHIITLLTVITKQHRSVTYTDSMMD